ncbi:hydroxymethylpyrimidine/phosphomethylpyrimidine kinase [Isoptericola sp. CG 20/1183]|uniref:Hydroxymethylpyrimidine/phosphomethylpyrimidine kinase n=1 Tax=Isoptericola halotolerans TaxID=300560 RepID=A0ABX5E9A0_9MICO|nr:MULTISPECIES: bifunctional hydroxymethylpyrimidine kinase/phosphomethylpyrimidine kinase [Isoptericola]PRZ02634.1 hydroxymethylpyrimidine/phosphomethylpyrimidine kinase [Isoptericola sp. CG 20/1183]PRZ02986.1 hydroxymethylpyrimidine/phosphomethylpyrimidine kinase [Isoptericola halotolerans]
MPSTLPAAARPPWRPRPVPRVLSVAGSDPSGGAGVQADLKAVAAAGGYGMAAVTALTAQSTRGVSAVHVPPPSFLAQQLDTLRADVAMDGVKIGMLASAEVAEVVARWLDGSGPAGRPPVVVDPVMVATSGDRLLEPAAEDAVRGLLDRADVVTPNVPELAVLLGDADAPSWDGVLDQALRLADRHDVLVVAKGGHLAGDEVPDALVGPRGVVAELPGQRVRVSSTHGTGCSLSSGLVTRYARHGSWERALRETKSWLAGAITAGPALEVGGGRGPVDHFWALREALVEG